MSAGPLDRVVGEQMRSARLMRGSTQAAVAEALGVTRAFYSQLETGRQQWSVSRLAAAARSLGMTLTLELGPEAEVGRRPTLRIALEVEDERRA